MTLRLRLRRGSDRGRLKRERKPGREDELERDEELDGTVGEVIDGAIEGVERDVGVAAKATGEEAVEGVAVGAEVGLDNVGEDLDRWPIP